jgi:FkbM family methyltransferase
MNLSELGNLKIIFRKMGIYPFLQRVFYKIVLFSSKTSIRVDSIDVRFWTTTPQLRSRVENIGGEAQLLERFLKNILKTDLVWDVGAYIGMYSLFSSKIAAMVYSFEPEPNANMMLKKNQKLNNIKNIQLVPCALSDKTGNGSIYCSAYEGKAIHSIRKEPRLSTKGTPIKLYKGDDLVSNKMILPPNIVKIDVEGAECLVLSGMIESISESRCRCILIEVHPKMLPNFNSTLDDLKTLILKANFNISIVDQRGDEMHWICTR